MEKWSHKEEADPRLEMICDFQSFRLLGMSQDLAPLDVELNIKLADSLKIRGTKGSHSIVCDLRYSVAPHERVVKIYEYLWDDEIRGKEEGAFEVSDCITSRLVQRDH